MENNENNDYKYSCTINGQKVYVRDYDLAMAHRTLSVITEIDTDSVEYYCDCLFMCQNHLESFVAHNPSCGKELLNAAFKNLRIAESARNLKDIIRMESEPDEQKRVDFLTYNADMRFIRGCAISCAGYIKELDTLAIATEGTVIHSIDEIGRLLEQAAENKKTVDGYYINIELYKKIFLLMKALPDSVPVEFETREMKAEMIDKVLEWMPETVCPRFCIEARRYVATLDPNLESNNEELQKLLDFINPELPMEDYCKKYGLSLKFDPIERTEKWEEIILDVEAECRSLLKDENSDRMGFCHIYWVTKAEVLKKHYGIDWRTPSEMNPGVMFD